MKDMKKTKLFIFGLITLISVSSVFAQQSNLGPEQEEVGSNSSEAFEIIPLLEPEESEDIESSKTKVTFKTNVNRCSVYLNGFLQGKSKLNLNNLVEGFYLLHVSNKGYLPKENFIYVERGKAKTYYIELEPNEETLKKQQAAEERAAQRAKEKEEKAAAESQEAATSSEGTSAAPAAGEDSTVGDAK